MNHDILKQKFIARLNDEVKSKLKPEYDCLLDETIESVIDGNAKINGEIPKTENDFFITIGYGFITRIQLFESLLKPLLSDTEKRVININYRDKTFTYRN